MKTIGLILVIILLLVVLFLPRHHALTESFSAPLAEFPFKNVYNDKGERMNVILLSAPFRTIEHEQKYEEYRNQGLLFCGISSYLDFPNPIENPYEDRFHIQQNHSYPDMASAWLHCFRRHGYTERFQHLPHLLLTEADLKDVDTVTPSTEADKEYDFLYCCLKDNDQCEPGWQSYNRNWDLAKRCLEVMCSVFHLRGVLVGRQNCEFSGQCDGIVKVIPFLPHHEFQAELRKCRFLFVPNIADASPRVITEAITMDIPVLVNEQILGGWHNVIPGVTGEFFRDETDLPRAIRTLHTTHYHPRKWFSQNRGKQHSGKQLAEFLRGVFPSLPPTSIATITI